MPRRSRATLPWSGIGSGCIAQHVIVQFQVWHPTAAVQVIVTRICLACEPGVGQCCCHHGRLTFTLMPFQVTLINGSMGLVAKQDYKPIAGRVLQTRSPPTPWGIMSSCTR